MFVPIRSNPSSHCTVHVEPKLYAPRGSSHCMEARGGASKLLHCTTGEEKTLSRVRAVYTCLFSGSFQRAPTYILRPTCACRCWVAPLSRGKTGECVVSGQVVAFLAGEVTPRAEGERLQSVHTCHVAGNRKENRGAFFFCGAIYSRYKSHTQWNSI